MFAHIIRWVRRKDDAPYGGDSAYNGVNIVAKDPNGHQERTMAQASSKGKTPASGASHKKPLPPRSLGGSGIYQFVGSTGLRVTITDSAKLRKAAASANSKKAK
jgi:hypothetical protein